MKHHTIGILICFLGPFTLYLLTLAPVVQSFDSAELTVGAYALGFVHPPGYPLYMLLGYLFAQVPIGNIALRLNLMSAIFGVLTTAVLYEVIFRQTRHTLTSVTASLFFSTMPIFWSQSIRAEVYTLHTFLVTSSLLTWMYAHQSRRKDVLAVCFFLLGLGMSHHPTTALLWASILLCGMFEDHYWRKSILLLTPVGSIIMGACYIAYVIWRSATTTVDYIRPYFGVEPGSLAGLWWLISAQAFHCLFRFDFNPPAILHEVFRLILMIWDNSLGIGMILAIWGCKASQRRNPSWNRLLSLYFLANVIAFFLYHAVDKEVMFIPVFTVGNIWVASGITELVVWFEKSYRKIGQRFTRHLPNIVLLAIIGIGVGINWSTLNLRNNRRAYTFAIQLLDEVPPATIIVNHWVTASVIDYVQLVDGKRPDVMSFNLDFYFLGLQKHCDALYETVSQRLWFNWLQEHMQQRPLCFLEPLPPIPSGFQWVKQGLCWTLIASE